MIYLKMNYKKTRRVTNKKELRWIKSKCPWWSNSSWKWISCQKLSILILNRSLSSIPTLEMETRDSNLYILYIIKIFDKIQNHRNLIIDLKRDCEELKKFWSKRNNINFHFSTIDYPIKKWYLILDIKKMNDFFKDLDFTIIDSIIEFKVTKNICILSYFIIFHYLK